MQRRFWTYWKKYFLLQVENVLTYWMNILQNLGLKCFVLPTFHSSLIFLCKAEAAPNVLHSVYYAIFNLKHPAILINNKQGWKLILVTTTLAYFKKDYTTIKQRLIKSCLHRREKDRYLMLLLAMAICKRYKNFLLKYHHWAIWSLSVYEHLHRPNYG
jgi:hypothetical protein